jgi:hypothetical protein
MHYFDEIRALPRDMQFDEDVLWACFVRAFELGEAGRPDQADVEKVSKLAHEWYDYLHYTNAEASEAFYDLIQKLKRPSEPGGGHKKGPID